MGLERTRDFLLSLYRVEETLQWNNFVYWVGDKAVGGKMFAMLEPEPGGPHVLGFAAAHDRLEELLEIEGVRPAPYLGRAGWVAVERWDTLPERDLHDHLRLAHVRVETGLPRRTQRALELNKTQYRMMVRERRAALKDKG